MVSKKRQAFRMYVHPCPRYLTGGDTHVLCVACLGEELEGADCEHCDVLPLRTLRSRLAFFHKEDAEAHVPRGSGSAAAEAQRKLQSWGLQIDLSAGLGMSTALSLPSPDSSRASYHETPAVVAQDQRIFSEGQPLSYDQGHGAMLTCLGNVKKPWLLSQGPLLGDSCRRKMLTIDASLMGWVAILEIVSVTYVTLVP